MRTFHLIDTRTPGDLLDQLAETAGPEDRVVSVGPAPDCMAGRAAVRAVHVPLGVPKLAAGRVREACAGAGRIHCWSAAAFLAAFEGCGKAGTPTLLSLAGEWDLPLGRPLARALKAARVTVQVPSRATADALAASGFDGLVDVVRPAAAGPAESRRRRERARSAMGLAEADRLVVSPGWMVRGAGHKIASWAHAIVRHIRREGQIKLAFCRPGPNEPHVRRFAATTGFDDDVLFTFPGRARAALVCEADQAPHATELEPPDVLAAADAAVFFGPVVQAHALLQARAARLPLAVARTAHAVELAGNGAILVPPDTPRDASAALLQMVEEPAASTSSAC
jgi:hypothetical protein